MHGRESVSAEVLHVAQARPVNAADPSNRDWLVSVAEISDRDVAAMWNGRYLLVESSSLPPSSADEIDIGELPGMRVELAGGELVGHVSEVYTAPQGFLLELETASGRPLVPWHDRFVQSVDETTRTIVLVPIDGLLD